MSTTTNDTRKPTSRTALSESDQQALAHGRPELEEGWAHLRRGLPLDAPEFESSAQCYLAFQRGRQVQTAEALLRLVLAYACGWSLRLVGAWAVIIGLADLSHVALRGRFLWMRRWLGYLIGVCLRLAPACQGLPPVRVRLVDATDSQRPGSHGTDWRLHIGFDLAGVSLDSLDITDAHGAESFARQPHHPGDPLTIWIGDRAYAKVTSLATALRQGVHLLVRWAWHQGRLETAAGDKFDVLVWLPTLLTRPADATAEVAVWWALPATATEPATRVALRLLAQRLPPDAAAKALRKRQRKAQKNSRTLSANSQLAAHFLVLVTNLPAGTWPIPAVLGLYRLRWQIECFFKRIKGLWNLGTVRAQNPELAQVEILSKVLAILLQTRWALPVQDTLEAWGRDPQRPLSVWRWEHLGADLLRHALRGPAFTVARCLRVWDRLRRFLCDTPRRRLSQLALARSWLAQLGVSAAEFADVQRLARGGDCTI